MGDEGSQSVRKKFQKNVNRRIKIKDILIEGNSVSREDVIRKLVSPVYGATTLGEVVNSLHFANERLRSLDVFKSVILELDTDPAKQRDSNEELVCNVNVKIKEGSRIMSKISANSDTYDAVVVIIQSLIF